MNAAQLNPGDVVAFKRGSDFPGHLIIQRSGTADHPIFFTAYGSSPLPVLDNGGSSSMPANVITFWSGASHVVIEQLLLENTLVAGVEIDAGSTAITVRDCEITKTGSGVSLAGGANAGRGIRSSCSQGRTGNSSRDHAIGSSST